jgi:HK97 family phage major capsid protein
MNKLSRLSELLKEANELQTELSEGKKEKESKVEANLSVEKLVDALGEKFAQVLVENKKATEGEAEQLKHKLFDNKVEGVALVTPDMVSQWQKAYKTSLDPAIKKEAGDNLIVTFFKAWAGFGKDEEQTRLFKALNEGTAGDGGYLVPTPLFNEVWRILPDYTVMRKLARIIPMSADTLKLDSVLAKPQAYWVSEYAQKTTTSAEFDQKTLNTNKLVCLLPATHELLADSGPNLAQLIIELFAEAVGEREDAAYFTGSGTGQPRGISQETLTTVTAGATFNFDDVIDLIYSIPQGARQNRGCAFVGNMYSVKHLRKVKDTNGDYIWRDGGMFRGEGGRVDQVPATLYGYPFYEQNAISQKTVYFGNWRYYIIGDRQQMTVSKTDEGGDAWRRDSTEFKAVIRVDGRAAMTQPFAKLNF